MDSLLSELNELLLKELYRWYDPSHHRFKRIMAMLEIIRKDKLREITIEEFMLCFSLNTPDEELKRARELITVLLN